MEYSLVIICGLVTLFGLGITVRCVLAQKRVDWLAPSSDPVHHNRKISVIIPARNEAFDIAPALRSVLNQQGVELARLLKTRQYRIGYRLAPACLRVRLFKNNRDAFWGNTKNILTAVEDHLGLAVPLMLVAILQYWTPVLAVIPGALMPDPLLLLVGLGTYAIQYVSFFTVRRILRFRPLKLLFFPLVAIVGTCCIGRALYYHRKGAISWRGRTIKVKEKG